MKLKVTSDILDYSGKPTLEVQPDGKEKHVTWQDIIFTVLHSTNKDEVLTKEEKEKFYRITKSVFENKEVELSVEDRALILERVSIFYGPLVYGRAKEFFEG